MSWTFEKAKFKVGDLVRFPYGRKIGRVKAVGAQVMESSDGRSRVYVGQVYRVSTYQLTEAQMRRVRARKAERRAE